MKNLIVGLLLAIMPNCAMAASGLIFGPSTATAFGSIYITSITVSSGSGIIFNQSTGTITGYLYTHQIKWSDGTTQTSYPCGGGGGTPLVVNSRGLAHANIPISVITCGQSIPAGSSGTYSFMPGSNVGVQVDMPDYARISGMTDLEFPNAQCMVSDYYTYSGLSTLSFPNLTTIYGDYSPGIYGAPTLNLSSLVTVNKRFTPGGSSGTQSLSLPNLTTVGTDLVLYFDNLSSLSMPSLTTVGGQVGIANNPPLTAVSMPALTSVGNSFSITRLTNLTSVNFPSLVTVSPCATDTVNFYGNNLDTVVFGTDGTIKTVACSQIQFDNNNLSQTSVDYILHIFASLDGTGGTTSWAGQLTLDAGTNAAPSPAGVVDAGIITDRGGYVQTN